MVDFVPRYAHFVSSVIAEEKSTAVHLGCTGIDPNVGRLGLQIVSWGYNYTKDLLMSQLFSSKLAGAGLVMYIH
ncbi:unnamed protein product [Sphenostylis stenocarpa]|uniref:Uncharacterized protein n=1 Tax=Sphenostylis stenocarpa TaxID=92480 RepID=A0AA86THS2_9FABA|nr:unnamed protein product [Sphenostylis stenocarpa]